VSPIRVVMVGGADMLQDVIRRVVDDDPVLELVGELATVKGLADLWERVTADVVIVRPLAAEVPSAIGPVCERAHIPAVLGVDNRGARGVIILDDLSRTRLAAAIHAAATLRDHVIPMKEAHMSQTSAANAKILIDSVLADHAINSLETFEWVTASPREVAGLYFYQQLDELIDLARAISFDFFARPHLYDALEDAEIVSSLAALHARYGHDEKMLSREQRQKIYEGIFTAGENQFTSGRDALLYAAAKFSERVYDTGEDMLRAAVRDAARTFKAYLTTLPGASLSWSRGKVLPKLTDKTAYRILRDRGIRAVFGQTTAIAAGWPYNVDGKGDELVEEASKCLHEPAEGSLSRDRFNAIQRVALRGAEAIATIVDYNDQPDPDIVDRLILKCYTWHAALVQVAGPPTLISPDGNRPLRGYASLSTT
jgi:hypothetical protein